MLHQMKLFESAFNAIKAGSKTIEIRLRDEKRQLVKAGDEIEFCKLPELKEKLRVKVLKVEPFSSFKELMNTHPLEKFGAGRFKTGDELIGKLREIYSAEEEHKYGVLAIHIQLI